MASGGTPRVGLLFQVPRQSAPVILVRFDDVKLRMPSPTDYRPARFNGTPELSVHDARRHNEHIRHLLVRSLEVDECEEQVRAVSLR